MSSLKLENFNILKIIGRGRFSTVLVVERKDKLYAIKAVKKETARITSYGLTEKNVLKMADHPFLIHMIGCFRTPNHFCFLLEYTPGGNLEYYTEHRGKLPEYHAAFYGAQIAMAINFLHSHDIIHRDIKLQNILLDKQGFIKLTDFGVSIEVQKEGLTNSIHGTLPYMAPEVLNKDIYHFEIDWWSFGIGMYVMLYGKLPFSNICESDSESQLEEEIKTKPIMFQMYISLSAIDLLKGLLNRDPSKRLGKKRNFDDIRLHPFFTQIDFEKLERKQVEPPFVPLLSSPTDFHYFNPDHMEEFSNLTLSRDPNTEVDKIQDFDYIDPDWKG